MRSDHVGDYPAWAAYARKLLAERPAAQAAAAKAPPGAGRLQLLAAQQAAESRAERGDNLPKPSDFA